MLNDSTLSISDAVARSARGRVTHAQRTRHGLVEHAGAKMLDNEDLARQAANNSPSSLLAGSMLLASVVWPSG